MQAHAAASLNSRELNTLIRPLRTLDNHTNLIYLAVDYLCLVAVMTATISFFHNHRAWGFSSWWLLPVGTIGIFLIGALQHRLAGLAHEGAHYILLKNRVLNELVSDLFCLFPLFSTTEQYRQIHLGHHEFTNDWERDPELLNLGETRMMDKFPMTRGEFIYNFVLRLFWPPTMIRYMWDNIYVTALGRGVHPYMMDTTGVPMVARHFRLTSVLALGYIALMVGVMGYLSWYGSLVSLTVAPVVLWLGACAVIAALPSHWFFTSRLRPVYSNKITSALRLGYLTALETVLAQSRFVTGTEWGVYFWLLWVLPLFTTFPYLMLLRDLFQHANADDGKLTNSRVAFCNPLLRWAMFIYGQDVHLTHHLYPAIPHYRLPQLHQLLKENCPEYAANVVEVNGGKLLADAQRPGLLDVLQVPCERPIRRPDAPPATAKSREADRCEAASAGR